MAIEDKENLPAKRDPTTGRFLPGQSGNPTGKLPGTKSKITLARAVLELELREQLKPSMGKILKKAVEMALQGDRMMIKLLVDKAMPNSQSMEDDGTQVEKLQFFIVRLPDREEKPVNGHSVIDSIEEN